MRFAKSLSMRSGSRCCLGVVREACLPPSGVTCRAQLQLSVFWHQFNPPSWKAGATATYPSEIPHCPPLHPIAGYFSHTLRNVRVGFVQQSSKSPQSSSICNHILARGDLLDSRFSALFSCRQNSALQAANDPRPLDIRVQVNGFGAASSKDITVLLQSAAFALWRHCCRTQLGSINVESLASHTL